MKHSHQPKEDSLSSIHEFRGIAKTRLLLSMIITGSVMIIEVFGSILTGSLALGSDASHMFTHLFALSISFVAITIACKEPCHHRTFGFYRAEILAALFNSIFLFGVTAFIFYQGVERLLNPQPVMGFEMFLVALLGLVANGSSILILRGASRRNDLNVKGAFLHMFADAASSVVIIAGAAIVSLTHWYMIDPILAVAISVVIFIWAWGLFRDSVNILLETAPKGMDIDTIGSDIKSTINEINEITDLHLWEITSGMYFLTAHFQIKAGKYAESGRIMSEINKLLEEKYGIEHTTLQIEEDVR
jgi:cobalt-zinc-cadmium efflux system protein